MDTALWRRASTIFAATVELAPAARQAVLARECGDDDALRRAVERLLAAHHGDDDARLHGLERAVDSALAGNDDGEHAPGERVGHFVVVRELGAGGMGRVYLAEREVDGATQRVALKIPGARALDAEFRARLTAERRTLATLEHAGIARLVDVGELADGRPYFAMEYVAGPTLTGWCAQHALDVPARLRVFLQVCAAVQHAHQHLIVHRDIKAANVLVADDGTVKLLDFGIAKPLGAAAVADGALTREEQRFFSPATAAPEQVLGRATGVATDIYALGVLAYQLLAGAAPYAVDGRSYAEVIRAIVDETPPAMSATVLARGDGDAARERRFATAAAHARALRGDLDLIVAKALRKDPVERYPSVEQFAADLRAVLERRPIAIRARERWYRVGRFVRRHTLPLALAVFMLLLVIAFALTATLQARRVAHERDRARAQQQHAEFERNRAERVVAFLIDLFRASDPRNARGEDIRASELLQRGEQRLAHELRDDPALRAALLSALSDIEYALNRFDAAARYAAEAAQLRAGQPDDAAALAHSRVQQSRIAGAMGRYDEALALADQGLALVHDHALDAPPPDALQAQRAYALQYLGRNAEAEQAWREIVAMRRARDGAAHERSIDAQRRLAAVLRVRGNNDEAATLMRDAITTQLAAIADEHDARLPALLVDLANAEYERHQFAQAAAHAERALRVARAVYGEQHLQTATAHNMVAQVACEQQAVQACRDHLQHSLAIRTALLGDEHPQVAVAEFNLGTMWLYRRADAAAALPHLQRAVQIAGAFHDGDHYNLNYYRIELGAALADLGRARDARAVLSQALAAFRRLALPDGLKVARAEGELACLDLREQHTAAASAAIAAALTVLATAPDETDVERERLARCAQDAAVSAR